MTTHRNRFVWILAALLVSVVACAPEGEERALPSGSHADEDAAPQGSAQIPENFPADFPLPPDFEVTDGLFVEGDAFTQANFQVRGVSERSVSELESFYHDRLPESGYRVPEQRRSTFEDRALIHFESDQVSSGSVHLNREDGRTHVLLSLPLRD